MARQPQHAHARAPDNRRRRGSGCDYRVLLRSWNRWFPSEKLFGPDAARLRWSRLCRSTNLGFWSSSIRLKFDSCVSVLLFAHSRNEKSRWKLRKTERAKFLALKSRNEISEIQLSGVGSRLPSVGTRFGGALAIGTRSPFDARPIERAEQCPAAAGAPGGGPTCVMVGQNSTTMISRCSDG